MPSVQLEQGKSAVAMTARKAPAFQFYADDFIAGTVDLSPAAVGVYMRFLCYQWSKGALPNERRILRRISGCTDAEFDEVWGEISHKFTEAEGGFQNKRMEKVREIQATRAESGSRGGSKRQAKPKQTSSKTEANLAVDEEICLEFAPKQNSTLHLQVPSPSPSPSSTSNDLNDPCFQVEPSVAQPPDESSAPLQPGNVDQIDFSCAEQQARELFDAMRYDGDEGQSVWKIAGALALGKLAESEVFGHAYEARKAREPPAYLVKCVSKDLAKRGEDLTAMLRKISLTPFLPNKHPNRTERRLKQ